MKKLYTSLDFGGMTEADLDRTAQEIQALWETLDKRELTKDDYATNMKIIEHNAPIYEKLDQLRTFHTQLRDHLGM